jgi:hypothetical protein
MKSLTPFLQCWRSTTSRDREIVDAVVAPAHRGPSPELEAALRAWPGVHYWVADDGEGRLMLIRFIGVPQRERWWLHGVLFLATFLTVWMAGAVVAGAAPDVPAMRLADLPRVGRILLDWLAQLRPGLEFAMALVAILLAHETGHYLTAKRYGVNASPPYFLPAPPLWNFVGTFGAFIRLRSPIADRRQLLDIGAAGPWAGFVVSMLFLALGLPESRPFSGAGDWPFVIAFAGRPLPLGDSLITWGARTLLLDGGSGPVALHPVALAGWVGLLVTTLNLLPLGQLDGGHILYALVGRHQAWIGRVTWLAVLLLGFWFWPWWIWAFFTLILGRGSLTHPTVLDRYRRIPANRQPYGWASALLFVATFTPVPFYI